ncbi:MAG: ABC transporter ATP-binding protein [Devosia sp.]
MSAPILEVEHLVTRFRGTRPGTVITACDDVSLALTPGEIVGLVGESGCGKSTLGRTIVGLEKASSGRVVFDGVDLAGLSGKRLREHRRRVQYVFQDAYASLNPRQTIGQTLDEALKVAGETDRRKRLSRTEHLLEQVGLGIEIASRYSRELSGGQRQRVSIARALVMEPSVLICDEPVSALDLSIRAQVMNVFLRLRRELNMACLFIAHDLALVHQASQRILVMYVGKLVESGESDRIYQQSRHPYTQALLSAIPSADPDLERKRRQIILAGDVPSPVSPPSGCRFHTRCWMASDICSQVAPPIRQTGPDEWSACHFAERVSARAEALLREPAPITVDD